MLKAIIIDDSEEAIKNLEKTISIFFSSQLYIINSFCSPKLAIDEIDFTAIDVIFLDIEMPELNGFDFLASLPDEMISKVVIISAYEQYAISAIKNRIRYFITKPIILIELKDCINEIQKEKEQKEFSIPNENDLIMVVGHDKTQFFRCQKISRIQANRNYCHLYYEDKLISISKTLKYFDERLPQSLFYRANRSHLINYNFIVEIRKNATGSRIFLKDGTILEVSNLKKPK